MSVSSAMYAAVTGLAAMSTGMQVISNNIANVNTVGFKSGRANFEDLISQDYWSNGRIQQIGRGVRVASVQQMFTQGSFMNSASDTDMAIAGDGFFCVRDRVTNEIMYTRAGNFTFDDEGVLESPSGYVLQGWELSIPKPGADPVRIGTPTDVKVIAMNAPPVATSIIKVVTNLDADDETAFPYKELLFAEQYADQIAIPAAEEDREAAALAVFNSADVGNYMSYPAYSNAYYNWLAANPSASAAQAQSVALAQATADAAAAGAAAYQTTYKALHDSSKAAIEAQLQPWQLEGDGFAEAWDATKLPEHIDDENYTYAQPMTIYDTLGNGHELMVYYQPNPHMENVWDYIITCDPTEDARKDPNNALLLSGATFAGLIQKGKLTFSANGPDGHGGVLKDIEAQNLDLNKTKAATWKTTSALPATSPLSRAVIGGYYAGSSLADPTTGDMVSCSRTYTLSWVGNLPSTVTQGAPISGMVWYDGVTPDPHYIEVPSANYRGPYQLGSGLTVTFADEDVPLNMAIGDSITIEAHSESKSWTNLTPNDEGYFDFDVAFVQSASMALHPPYPPGMPTVIQHISMDMGARNPYGQNPDWILDEQSTTQYASKSITLFDSQDGYPPGSLKGVSIGTDGIMTGIYTNGRHQPLYQIGLAKFLNPHGLTKLGDNVYAETRWSGDGVLNPAGYGGTGTIRSNFLEQSNVDLAGEIVNMIITQRAFQANSKVVTTTDTMLAEVIEMKR